jgi:phosphatidylglycerol:prolipoprotein diacylglycerol transferase
MHNELLTIGPFTIYGYGLMIAIGILACFLLADYRAKKLGLDADLIFNTGLISVIVGVLCAKLGYLALNLSKILASDDPWQTLTNSGFIVYSGLIGGILCGWVIMRLKKESFLTYFDLAAPSIAIAQGFGRIGCFLAGCCYGHPTNSPFGMVFRNSVYVPHDLRGGERPQCPALGIAAPKFDEEAPDGIEDDI